MAVTVAPAMGAPLGSVIIPLMAAEVSCPAAGDTVTPSATITSADNMQAIAVIRRILFTEASWRKFGESRLSRLPRTPNTPLMRKSYIAHDFYCKKKNKTEKEFGKIEGKTSKEAFELYSSLFALK